MKVKLNRIDSNYHFEGIGVSKIPVNIDGSVDIGGNNSGVRPMELILMGLGSCGAMDIISILKKQKQEPENIEIEIDGLRDYNKTPAVFTEINIEFMFYGELDQNKVRKAVELSMDKYCSVSEMLKNQVKIYYSFKIISER